MGRRVKGKPGHPGQPGPWVAGKGREWRQQEVGCSPRAPLQFGSSAGATWGPAAHSIAPAAVTLSPVTPTLHNQNLL